MYEMLAILGFKMVLFCIHFLGINRLPFRHSCNYYYVVSNKNDSSISSFDSQMFLAKNV